MRTLFIPLAKLLGVFAIFRPLFYIEYMIYMVSLRAYSGQGSIRPVLIFSGIHAAGILLALILIFKTEKIADILKIPHDSTNSVVFDSGSILRIGLLLMGVGILIYAIPNIISSVVRIVQQKGNVSWAYQDRLCRSILETVFGSCLVLYANRLAQFLDKQKSR